MNLILASASPRRALLLQQVGIPYEVVIPDVTEKIDKNLHPRKVVVEIARYKANAVRANLEKGIVLAADTIVALGNSILGKPEDKIEAYEMLKRLSGQEHLVLTGLVLHRVEDGTEVSGVAETRVWMKKLSAEVIKEYVESGEPLDKAGAYGIQGRAALFIERIDGCYFNVVGLPLSLLNDLLKKI